MRIPRKSLDEQINNFDKQIVGQAELDQKTEAVYRSVPGIGGISSRLLANELGNMSQFKNEDALFSFIGLTPTEYSSGDATRKGHISRQGNPRIRHTMLEVSWRAINKDKALRDDFERISVRGGSKKAIVAAARRLIGRIRACFRKGNLYEIGYEPQLKTA